MPGTQPPAVEHFSVGPQSAGVVHFGVHVPLCRQTAVLPQLPTPWQLCAQVPALVQAWPERQSASAPQPVSGTQPFDVEHFSLLAQFESSAHFVAQVLVSRQLSVGEQSVPDWQGAPIAPAQVQPANVSAAPKTRSENHREVCSMSCSFSWLDPAGTSRSEPRPRGVAEANSRTWSARPLFHAVHMSGMAAQKMPRLYRTPMNRLPFALALVAFAAQAQPAGWSLDVSATELAVKTWKTGVGASLAHDHVLRATKFSGKGSLDDSGAPESLKLELTVEVAGLIPDEPETRRKYFLPNTPVPAKDRQKVLENMLSDEQLDAAKFPTISFVVSKVSIEASGALRCQGKLTLHGVTKEVSFPIKVKTGDRQAEGDAQVRLKTSDFGVKPYSAALGLIRNKDEVELVVHVVLKR